MFVVANRKLLRKILFSIQTNNALSNIASVSIPTLGNAIKRYVSIICHALDFIWHNMTQLKHNIIIINFTRSKEFEINLLLINCPGKYSWIHYNNLRIDSHCPGFYHNQTPIFNINCQILSHYNLMLIYRMPIEFDLSLIYAQIHPQSFWSHLKLSSTC